MNWRTVKIKDVCLLALDCVNKTAPVVDYATPFKMIRTTNVRGGFVDVENVRYVTEDTFEKWTRRSRLSAGDVILTREAPLGDVGRLTVDDNIFLGQRLFQFRADPQKIHPDFLAFVLQSPLVQGRIRSKGLGATVQHAKVGDFVDLEIPLPPLEEQKAIGETLAAYNDLIENNRRRIDLLEQSTRLLFKEWFGHLRYPGHEHDKIVDGVPVGWERVPLGDLCTLRAGDVFKPQFQGERTGDHPFIKVGDFNNPGNKLCITVANNWVSQAVRESQKLKLFPPETSVFAKIGEALRQNRVRYLVRETLIDNNVMGAIPKRDVVEGPLLFCMLANHDLATHASGAAVPFLSSGVLNSITFLKPSRAVQMAFSSHIGAMIKQISVLERQATESAKARDILLPRLMDGRIAV